jgi:hypothetical protein|tara:strand:+ start:2444 stop:3619 length:1176 start_codon:yes stop_codon:yes gene_type:complete
MTVKIGFPYFYHPYHAYHSAPIGFELSRLDPNLEITFITTSKNTYDLLNEMGSYYENHRCSVHLLPSKFHYYEIFSLSNYLSYLHFRFIRQNHSSLTQIPSPIKMINKYAKQFKQMDIIIDTNFLSLRLKKLNNNNVTKYIQAFHGGGDRKREFSKHLKRIDFFLLCGPKRFRRLDEAGYLNNDNWAYFGYPKFDLTLNNKIEHDLFNNNRPIVLYNPHFEPHLTSWFDWGKDILDYFAKSKKYNLIFAPHVELKGRSSKRLSLKKYEKIPHMHIDLGSQSLIDMTYTNIADLYIGDVSSQIVEYLVKPRPCIFLNNHNISWKDNPYFVHWALGPIIEHLSQLDMTIYNSLKSPNKFLSIQKEYFADSIQLENIPSGLRAAQEVLKFLKSI